MYPTPLPPPHTHRIHTFTHAHTHTHTHTHTHHHHRRRRRRRHHRRRRSPHRLERALGAKGPRLHCKTNARAAALQGLTGLWTPAARTAMPPVAPGCTATSALCTPAALQGAAKIPRLHCSDLASPRLHCEIFRDYPGCTVIDPRF